MQSTTAVLGLAMSAKDPLAAGRELGVKTVLDGRVQRLGERIRVTVQLVDVRDGKTLWAEKFDEKFTDVFEVQDSVSEQVTRALMLKLTNEEQQLLSKRFTEDSEAFQAYIKGRYFWNKRTTEGLKKGLDFAEQAIAIDPTYAMAYVGVADSYSLLCGHGGLAPRETFPKAKAAALRALEIDQELAEAYASLAFVAYRYDYDWIAAERNFKKAMELKPNYPTAHHWFGESLVALGRFDESLAELVRAQELDPLSLPINTDLGQTLFFTRKYDEAIEQLREALEMDQSFVRALIILGGALEQKGEIDEAITALRRATDLSPENTLALSGLGHALGLADRKDEALEIARQMEEMSRRRYVSSYNYSLVLIGLGENERALDMLEKAFSDRDVWLVWLRVNPRFDCIRGSERFVDLMGKVGLIQG